MGLGMDLEFIRLKKLYMKDNGKKARKREREKLHLRVVVFFKVTLKMI